MFTVPEEFRSRPFSRGEALAAGISARVLEGVQFTRVHEAVYRHRDHVMSFDDEVEAASLALPAAARTTGLTRLRQAGLAYGSPSPLHFVAQGDHHLALQGVFLHRTVLMPPCDEVGVTPTAAFVAHCVEARVIDAIKVGSWLVHRELLDLEELDTLVHEQRWRWGCKEAAWVLEHLDGRCRSLPESELLALVRWSGLPDPEVNAAIEIGDGEWLTPDLWWARWRRIAEYEGSQHQEDRSQYISDIDRYRAFRRIGADYELVTKETLRTPRTVVRRIHRMLVEAGYDGPAPELTERWALLFRPLREVVRELGRLAA
ncbi:MAG: hypothetical protein LT071_04100 [Nocardioides sp.]|nr:hypothetical protein [Nocardioides sp.]